MGKDGEGAVLSAAGPGWEFGLRSLQFSPSLAWVPGSDSLQAGSQALNGGMCEAFSFHMLLSRAQRIAWTQAAPLRSEGERNVRVNP